MKKLVKIIKSDQWASLDIVNLKQYFEIKNRISEKDNYLFVDDNTLFIPDVEARSQIIETAHENCQGIGKTIAIIAELYYWPNYTAEVRSYIENCEFCKNNDRTKKTFVPPMQPTRLVKGPWRYLLVLVDYYSVAFGCGERTAQDGRRGRNRVSTILFQIHF